MANTTNTDTKIGENLEPITQIDPKLGHVFSIPNLIVGTKEMFRGGPLNILLLFVPLTFIAEGVKWPSTAIFIFSLLSICPLAERLGFVTEQLAFHTNEAIGGLLNASFGNATELIVAIAAVSKGLNRVVQLTILGSMLSNLLLVMGCAFAFGGYSTKIQRFETTFPQMNSILLMIATMVMLFPPVMRLSGQITVVGELSYSRFSAILLILIYIIYLYFQLYSHAFLFDSGKEVETAKIGASALGEAMKLKKKKSSVKKIPSSNLPSTDSSLSDAQVHPMPDLETSHHDNEESKEEIEHEEESEELVLDFYQSLLWLALITILISFLSDSLVGAIVGTAKTLKISSVFLSVIVIPIIGNAAEHAGAVLFAMRNKLDMSLGIAMGSSTQIALMVMPLLIIIGWGLDVPISINFGAFEAFTMFLTVIIVMFCTITGESTFLSGVVLIAAYFVISAAFWVHANEDVSEE